MRRERAGVTLVEVMIAMTIIAIVTSLMYTGFAQTAQNKRRIESETERYHEIRMGLERMARELSMAYVSLQVNPNEALRPMLTAFVAKDDGGGSRIDFTSFSHRRLYRDAHESDQNELGYFVTDHPEDPSREVLARREQHRIDDVVRLELTFLDPLSQEWVSTWDTTQAAMQPSRLPAQVLIRVTVPNVRGNGPEQTFATRTALGIRYSLNHAIYRTG